MTSYQLMRDPDIAFEGGGLPRVDLNLYEHKLPIAIHWTILFISSGVLPIALYFALRYSAHLALGTVLAVTTAIFGVVTVFSFAKRTWQLLKKNSTCRPLNASRAAMDYFHWNFLVGIVSITSIVVAGNLTLNIRIVTLGLPILIADVSLQMLLVGILHACGARAPFRMSSVAKGDKIRSGVYAIAEDIVAVDGGQGQHYRRQLQNRYLASSVTRSLCLQLDILFGVSGIAVASGCFALIYLLESDNIAYIMGWVIPWGYAAVMTLITIRMVSNAVDKENRSERGKERLTTQDDGP